MGSRNSQCTYTLPTFLRLTRRSFHLLLAFSLLTVSFAAQNDKDILPLELGRSVERDLAGGQAHSYRIVLGTGQFLRVVADQRGIDVVLTLFGPDGNEQDYV